MGNCGAFARLVSPGGGALANLVRPGGALASPGGTLVLFRYPSYPALKMGLEPRREKRGFCVTYRRMLGTTPIFSLPGFQAHFQGGVRGSLGKRTRGTPENVSQILKLCFLNFKMYFNLKGHNFKANSILLFSKQFHLKMFMIS